MLGHLWATRTSRAALCFLSLLLLVALGADLVASDLPIALRYDGNTYILPALTRPGVLRAYNNQSLARDKRVGWMVRPLCPYGPAQVDLARTPPAAPGGGHWLGTDDRGRDVFARVVHGSRVALLVGVLAVLIAAAIGLLLGVVAGYFRGAADFAIARLIEVGLSFPTFFLVLAVVALAGRASTAGIVLVIGLTRWTAPARLARAEALRLRELDYVLAARAFGASSARIIWVHLLPGTIGPVLVNATFGVGAAILTEGALSFLGFGVPPPTASWGEILGQAYEHQSAWWLVVFPGLALFLTVLAVNVIGERLRGVVDPRTRTH